MPYLIVEYDHDPPVSNDQLMAASEALGDCLNIRGITRLRSWVSNDRKRGFCEYKAADAESVREAYHSAKVGFSRIWSATLFEPDAFPDAG